MERGRNNHEAAALATEGIEIAWQSNAAFDALQTLVNERRRLNGFEASGLIHINDRFRVYSNTEIALRQQAYETFTQQAGELIGPGTPGGRHLERRVSTKSRRMPTKA